MARPLTPAASDADLVSAIRLNTSDAAFSILYDRHTPRVFQTAWRILGGDEHLAEDAIQEAWVRAVSNMDRWSRNEAFGAWLRAIAALPPGYRAVLVLHDVEGFTHEEIARQLGITAGTSKGQLFKARRAARARLGITPTEKA